MRRISSSQHAFAYALGAFFLLYAFVTSMLPIWDTDIFWHLRVGEWIIQHSSFPKMDLFSSIDPEREWRTFNWLFEVMAYGIHQILGLFGLRVMIAFVVLVGYALWFLYFIRETKNTSVSIMLLTLLLVLFADRLRVRPHVFNLPFEALILLFFQSGETLRIWQKRSIFLFLGILWSNLHNPCAVVGASVLIAGCLGRMAISTFSSKIVRENLWPIGLSIVSIVANPYGISLPMVALENISAVRADLGEWQSPLAIVGLYKDLFHLLSGLSPLFVLFFFILTLKMWRKNKKAFTDGIAPFVFLIISQVAIRFAYLSTAMLAWVLARLDIQTQKVKMICVVIALILFSLAYNYQITYRGGPRVVFQSIPTNLWPDTHPDLAVDLIRTIPLHGKMFTSESWGSYILWFAHPLQGVSADARNNMSPEVIRLQNLVYENEGKNTAKIIRVWNDLNMDVAIMPTQAFPQEDWPIDQWILIAKDAVVSIFVRVGSEDMSQIQLILGLSKTTSTFEIQQAAQLFFSPK